MYLHFAQTWQKQLKKVVGFCKMCASYYDKRRRGHYEIHEKNNDCESKENVYLCSCERRIVVRKGFL